MNELREAIERVGARFDPGPSGFEDLTRRRARGRVRRRIFAGAMAAAVLGVGSLILVRALPATSPRWHPKVRVVATWAAGAGAAATPVASQPVECPTPSGDSPPPVRLSATSGSAGSSVEVSGTFWSDKVWMQLLWNAGELGEVIPPPPWPDTGPDLRLAPAGPGPVVRLAAIASPAVTGECSFTTQFTVPDVSPGTYQLRWFFGGMSDPSDPSHPQTAYIWSSELSFQVTG